MEPQVVQELRKEVTEKLGLSLLDGKIRIVGGLLPYEDPLVKDLQVILPVSKAAAK